MHVGLMVSILSTTFQSSCARRLDTLPIGLQDVFEFAGRQEFKIVNAHSPTLQSCLNLVSDTGQLLGLFKELLSFFEEFKLLLNVHHN